MSPSPDVKTKKKKALFNYKEKFIVINENKIQDPKESPNKSLLSSYSNSPIDEDPIEVTKV